MHINITHSCCLSAIFAMRVLKLHQVALALCVFVSDLHMGGGWFWCLCVTECEYCWWIYKWLYWYVFDMHFPLFLWRVSIIMWKKAGEADQYMSVLYFTRVISTSTTRRWTDDESLRDSLHQHNPPISVNKSTSVCHMWVLLLTHRWQYDILYIHSTNQLHCSYSTSIIC